MPAISFAQAANRLRGLHRSGPEASSEQFSAEYDDAIATLNTWLCVVV
jgi:hypothetical protein